MSKKRLILFFRIFFFLFTLTLVNSLNAQIIIQGQVVGVSDGDTITVLQNNKEYKIRLYGIDCPERKQAFGRKAKSFTSDMVYRCFVKVVSYGKGKYGRTIGMVYINSECLNEELLKAGFAWVYRKYCRESFCNKFLKYERVAKENKIGLWVDKDPLPPWEYRGGKTNTKAPIKSGSYHGNIKSNVFHKSSCKYFDCKSCMKNFQSKEEAINEGYRPCGLCNP